MKPNGFQLKAGKWHKTKGELKMCENGFHASENIIDAMYYVPAEVLAKVEVRGKSIIQHDKQCWEEMKIVKTYKWTKKDSISLAIFAAELVLDNYGKQYPNDLRPRQAIEAAKKVLENDTKENRIKASSAASYAASAAYAASSAASTAASSADYEASSVVSAASAAPVVSAKIRAQCHDFVIKRLKKCEF